MLFLFRRVVQDKARVTLREETPDVPAATQPTAEGTAARVGPLGPPS